MQAGWWLAYLPEAVIHHAASTARDPTARRVLGLRNTLWFTWLRRPAPAALRRTGYLLATVPRDRPSMRAFVYAVRGLPWVLRQRRPVAPAVEARLAALEKAQRQGTARRYVG